MNYDTTILPANTIAAVLEKDNVTEITSMTAAKRNIPVFDHSAQANATRMPTWIRQAITRKTHYAATSSSVHNNKLTTVCEEARCPNQNECWNRGTATFMLLGDTCTRACGFCAVKTGRPGMLDRHEPVRVAQSVAELELDFVVLTSVNRDELVDGGVQIFADTLMALRKQNPSVGVEFLTPDFRACQENALLVVVEALRQSPYTGENPIRLIWGHNVETVPSLYKQVRKGSSYKRSLRLLQRVGELDHIETKSSLMLGLGETQDEVFQVMQDLRNSKVERLALGQYLRPTRYHLPVREYVPLDRFASYEKMAKSMGFSWVKSGPMVRSSYHAEE
jgi:lipoic acid synthetase